MLGHTDEERKLIIENRIINEVRRFNESRNEGMPMQSLSCKYSKVLSFFGGFPETMENLARIGALRFQILPTGARLVFVTKDADTNLELLKTVNKRWY